MVKKIRYRNREAYECEECGFKYSEEEIAQKCEQFCKTHNGCSMEITKSALR